ncbi:MAG: hypothetical protein OEV44_08925 [Spirochaetota bacterium]|nr:hypothetical protein [Spirochaetota bacterium]
MKKLILILISILCIGIISYYSYTILERKAIYKVSCGGMDDDEIKGQKPTPQKPTV